MREAGDLEQPLHLARAADHGEPVALGLAMLALVEDQSQA